MSLTRSIVAASSKFVFEGGKAKRESDESARLCQSAVPLQYVAELFIGVRPRQAHIKATILPFLTRVYGRISCASRFELNRLQTQVCRRWRSTSR